MWFPCFGDGCLGSWGVLRLWLEAESLWDSDRESQPPEGAPAGPPVGESEYWGCDPLEAPW